MIPLLIGLAGIGAYLVYSNWQEVENWLKYDPMDILKTEMQEAEINDYAAEIFSTKEGNIVRIILRIYYKENGKWVEKTTVREINESEVPAWAIEGLTAKEQDVTECYRKNFSLDSSSFDDSEVPAWARRT